MRKDSERMWLGASWGPYKTKGGSARSSVSPVETLLPVVISSSQAPSLRASAGEGGPATKAYDLQLAREAGQRGGLGCGEGAKEELKTSLPAAAKATTTSQHPESPQPTQQRIARWLHN